MTVVTDTRTSNKTKTKEKENNQYKAYKTFNKSNKTAIKQLV